MRIRFDRGTLVIDQAPNDIDPKQLLGATWDDDLAAWRLPAERLSDVRGRLSAKAVRLTDDIAPSDIAGQWALPELRWYQRDALGAWRDSGDRGVIVLPTGAGKTLVALAAIAELHVATLILVPTRVLLDQWARTLEAAWPHPIGRLGDGDHRPAPITVATYASAVTWAPRLGDRFGLVIVDEAHHVGAWCPAEILEMLVAPARLGLTATPPDGPAAWQLSRRIGPTVFTLGVDALRGTALADYTHETVVVELDPVERNAYKRFRGEFSAFYALAQRGRRLPWRQFVLEAQRSLAGRDALAAWRASRALLAYPAAKRARLRDLLQRHSGERVLIFTADNATAYAIARELLVVPITCDIGRTERVEMLDRFRTGACSVLVSAQVLDEGFDVPDAEVAIIVGGTSSQRRQAQRIGRVLRPRPGKRAYIYELAVDDSAEVRQVKRRRGANAVDDTRDLPLELPLATTSFPAPDHPRDRVLQPPVLIRRRRGIVDSQHIGPRGADSLDESDDRCMIDAPHANELDAPNDHRLADAPNAIAVSQHSRCLDPRDAEHPLDELDDPHVTHAPAASAAWQHSRRPDPRDADNASIDTHVGAHSTRRPAGGPDNVSAETSRADMARALGAANASIDTHVGAHSARPPAGGPDNVSAEPSRAHVGGAAHASLDTHKGAQSPRRPAEGPHTVSAETSRAHVGGAANASIDTHVGAHSTRRPAGGRDNVSAETSRAHVGGVLGADDTFDTPDDRRVSRAHEGHRPSAPTCGASMTTEAVS